MRDRKGKAKEGDQAQSGEPVQDAEQGDEGALNRPGFDGGSGYWIPIASVVVASAA